MVLEKEILTLTQWLGLYGLPILVVAVVLVLFGLFVGFLVNVVRRGPQAAIVSLVSSVRTACTDLMHLSPRRLWAMTWLAMTEALRRRVLVTFAVFVVLLLFAGWFLDRRTDNPGQLYITFVLTTCNFLILVLGIFLSTFSLPQDIKNRTVYTIVTKPVRGWEIILGRMFGFTIVGTMLLTMMAVFSYVFVITGLSHDHQLRSTVAQGGEQDGSEGQRTTMDHFHRHEIVRNSDGNLQTDLQMGHQHSVLQQNTETLVGPAQGMLQARVPVGGTLRFLDSSGKATEKGINVGYEWGYRSYIEGGTLATAIWTFDGITPDRFPRTRFGDGLPLEITMRVFRTYKGIIEQRIQGTITLVNPDPSVPEEARLRSTPFTFEPNEFAPKRESIPWDLKVVLPNGTTQNADLMQDFVHDGKLEVWIRCEDRAQYFGVARNDVYLRAADRPFFLNFVKGFISIWCEMCVVICFGVMFSTVLSGPVAMMAALGSFVLGYFGSFVQQIATGEAEGGGPIEAMIRVFTQKNLTLDLDIGTGLEMVVRAIDQVVVFTMWGITVVLPNFGDFSTTDFVAAGFNIPGGYIAQHLLMTLGYFLLAGITGYFLFKSREVAA